MVLRWGVATLLFAKKGFYRVRGYKHLGQLIEVLRNYHSKLAFIQKAA